MNDLQEQFREAKAKLADGFAEMEYICRRISRDGNFNEYHKARLFSPDGLGAVSAFLELGNGYEPAFKNNCWTITDIEHEIPNDKEGDESEDS